MIKIVPIVTALTKPVDTATAIHKIYCNQPFIDELSILLGSGWTIINTVQHCEDSTIIVQYVLHKMRATSDQIN